VRCPVPPPQEEERGSQVFRSDAVVGNHFSVGCWGPRSQEDAPGRPAALGSAWLSKPPRGTVPTGWVGQASGEEAPAPNSEGPLLPSRTPTPRNTAVAATGGLDARPCRAQIRIRWRWSGWAPGTLARARVRHQPRRYTYSGRVARFPTPGREKGFAGLPLGCRRRAPPQGRVLGAAVAGGCAQPPSLRGGAPGYDSVGAVPFRVAGWGKRRGEKAPAPNSEGPLLPARTPTPRNTAVAAAGGLDARPCRAQIRGRLRGNKRCARNPRACSGSAPA
jgi:hypothetical protein